MGLYKYGPEHAARAWVRRPACHFEFYERERKIQSSSPRSLYRDSQNLAICAQDFFLLAAASSSSSSHVPHLLLLSVLPPFLSPSRRLLSSLPLATSSSARWHGVGTRSDGCLERVEEWMTAWNNGQGIRHGLFAVGQEDRKARRHPLVCG